MALYPTQQLENVQSGQNRGSLNRVIYFGRTHRKERTLNKPVTS